jgi:hypothetical protein
MANGWDVTVVTTESGDTLTTCLNPFNTTHQEYQNYVGYSIASLATATFILLGVIGVISFMTVRRSFHKLSQFGEGISNTPSSRQKLDTVQMLPLGGRGSAESGQ